MHIEQVGSAWSHDYVASDRSDCKIFSLPFQRATQPETSMHRTPRQFLELLKEISHFPPYPHLLNVKLSFLHTTTMDYAYSNIVWHIYRCMFEYIYKSRSFSTPFVTTIVSLVNCKFISGAPLPWNQDGLFNHRVTQGSQCHSDTKNVGFVFSCQCALDTPPWHGFWGLWASMLPWPSWFAGGAHVGYKFTREQGNTAVYA